MGANRILLTQDPIGLAGGVNLYSYAGNNPIAFDDPFGLVPVPLIIAAAIALFEAASTAYDGYNAVSTLADDDASASDKGLAVAGFVAGLSTPGPGSAYVKTGGAAVKAVIRYTDDVARTSLRGKSLTSGSKALRGMGLTERVTKTGRREFVDAKGRVRAAYDASDSKGGNHWHKYGPDGQTPLNDAGRVVESDETAAHIPAK